MTHHRWYRDGRDLERMLALVGAATIAAGPRAGHLHPGDIVWGLFQNTGIDPATRVQLFEDASGELAGFVWISPPGHFMAALAPGAADPPATFAMMTTWAETHLSDEARVAGTPLEAITTEIGSIDHVTSQWLTGAGYRPTGEADFQGNHQVLDCDLPDVAMPEGATVRAVRGVDEREVVARVELHRGSGLRRSSPSRGTGDCASDRSIGRIWTSWR